MSQDVEKYRRWVRGANNSFSEAIYFLGKGIIQALGKEKGRALILRQFEEMCFNWGTQSKEGFTRQGLDNNLRNYFRPFDSGDGSVAFAWVYSVKKSADDERIIEYSYCPIAEGFKGLGEEAVEIGELFCNHADNTLIQAYNPDYECKRESSLNLDGLCRLHWKKKQ